jgi:hypothetical protein
MRAFCLPNAPHPWFYNEAMRVSLPHSLLISLALSSAGLARAQAPAALTPPTAAPTSGEVETRTERIQVDDGGARIDELRVGGETRSITVQPRGRLPSYEVKPVSGERSWKILGF